MIVDPVRHREDARQYEDNTAVRVLSLLGSTIEKFKDTLETDTNSLSLSVQAAALIIDGDLNPGDPRVILARRNLVDKSITITPISKADDSFFLPIGSLKITRENALNYFPVPKDAITLGNPFQKTITSSAGFAIELSEIIGDRPLVKSRDAADDQLIKGAMSFIGIGN